jgi:hypothetical protein
MVREKCRDIEKKLKHIESIVGFLEVMSDVGEGTPKTPVSEVRSSIDLVNKA